MPKLLLRKLRRRKRNDSGPGSLSPQRPRMRTCKSEALKYVSLLRTNRLPPMNICSTWSTKEEMRELPQIAKWHRQKLYSRKQERRFHSST